MVYGGMAPAGRDGYSGVVFGGTRPWLRPEGLPLGARAVACCLLHHMRMAAVQVREAASTESSMDEMLGDIPDEYLDPITQVGASATTVQRTIRNAT